MEGTPVPARRASPDLLVLGAGGPIGLAWELGWLAEAADLVATGIPVARSVATGKRRLFCRDVPLYLAVAASSAAPGRTGPVTVDGQEYIDGGIGSLLNSDLARGTGTVWVLAPAGLGAFAPAEAVPARMREEIAALGAAGARVEVFAPRGAFTDLGAFADAGRALDDGARVARTWLGRP